MRWADMAETVPMALVWEDLVSFAVTLPETEESTSYNTPALKVANKLIARLRAEAEGGVVVMCSLAEKEALLASPGSAYYTTDHYDGHGSIIVDLDRADATEVQELLTEAWRAKAPKRALKSL
ncbi:hypothetical protein CH293_23865 [Rhodococcus sp. 14-2470-1b]|nr:hypothetical protein CH301_24090 [Rhodococcus sp. 15-1189-1-1a]OZF09584.1 hypothetical protein CH299_24610 [Rhodococcus sp. 14-2686-1-2]OZF43989.1 hypothetical protein CH293_23865 [Rhodococcus sp. 14-2470-1b]